MRGPRRIAAWALIWIGALLVVVSPSVAAAQSRPVQFDIDSQALAQALVEFAIQANVSVGHAGLDLSKVRSPSLKGTYRLRTALTRLLEGTGYTFEIVDRQTVRIIKVQERPAAPSPQHEPPASRELAEPPRPPIEEIVITATKRGRTLQTLPYSAAVMTGTQIGYLGATSFDNLSLRFAGVTVTNLGAGRDKVLVRGLSDGTFTGRTQSTVGVYLDDSRLVYNAPTPHIILSDIDRVEVIRGPQGTLYGAGTIGGLYRIITNKPDPAGPGAALAVSGSTTHRGGQNAEVQGMVNIPLVTGRVALRGVGFYLREDGYIDDTSLGQNDINFGEITGGRASILLQIADGWLVTGGMTAQIISFEDTQYYQPDLGDLKRANLLQEPNDDDFRQYHMTIDGVVAGAELVSATSFVRRDIDIQFDASRAVPDLVDQAIVASPFTEAREIRTVYHETRLRSPDEESFQWLAGGVVSVRRESFDSFLEIPGADPEADDLVFVEERDDDVIEFALFGEGSIYLTQKLSLTGGLRFSRSVLDVMSLRDGLVNEGPSEVAERVKKSGVTPKFVVSYQADEDRLYYAQAAQGFRVGGININSPAAAFPAPEPDDPPDFTKFASDKMWNFELGSKLRLFDRRLVANVAAFYTIWNDIQSDQLLDNGFKFIVNAGDARNKGVEVELLWRPTAQVELQGNFFWNDPELVRANAFLGALPDNRLPGVPQMSFGLSGYYEIPLGSRSTVFLSADYAYVGASRLTFDEKGSPSMGKYHLGNMRVGWTHGIWQVRLFLDNVWDSRGNTFAFGNPFSLGSTRQVTPPRPRTLGLAFAVNY